MGARVEVGAIGWQHKSWNEDFYPDELPDEWMLSYYANEFRCVYVPHADWFDMEKEGIAQWHEDVHEQFSFILELAPDSDFDLKASAILDRVGVLGDRLAGIVIKPHDALSLSSDEVKAFLRELATHTKVYVNMPVNHVDEQNMDVLAQLGCKVCWNSMVGEEFGGACLGIIQSDVINCDLRLMRAEVQNFLDQLNDCSDACLFIDGSPPPLQLMRDTMVILSLLDV